MFKSMSTAELRQLRASVEIEVAKREAATLNAEISGMKALFSAEFGGETEKK